MEAKKGNASSPQKYHPFLMAAEELGGWFMGKVGGKIEKSKSPFKELAMLAHEREKVQHTHKKKKKTTSPLTSLKSSANQNENRF